MPSYFTYLVVLSCTVYWVELHDRTVVFDKLNLLGRGELELPFLFVLLVIIAPYQAMNLRQVVVFLNKWLNWCLEMWMVVYGMLLICRGTQAGIVISIAASAYLIYQHVTRTGGIKKAFDQGVVVPTIAAACLICVPFLFPVKGYIF